MISVAVAPHCRSEGFDGVRERVDEAYEVLELRDALNRIYRTDAHLVTYVVSGARRQPRINKSGLPLFPYKTEVSVLFCDSDNPGHESWTDALFEGALKQYETLDILQTAGVYHTAHGRRIVQPLRSPIPVQEVEPYIHSWLLALEQAGVPVDWKCREWNRHFRLPHVVRDGVPYRSPWMRLDCMQSVDVEPLPSPPPLSSTRTTNAPPAPPRAAARVQWTSDVPAAWKDRVQTIARAVVKVETEWHSLFLALAGALLSRQVPPGLVPALCRAISLATGRDSRTDDREKAGETTVQRKLIGQPAVGYTRLRADWPDVANAFDEAMATGVGARMRALAAEPSPPVCKDVQQAAAEMDDVFRDSKGVLNVIVTDCGLGKTEAAIRTVIERAGRTHASPHAQGLTAPLGSKTSMSVDKNALALEIQERIENEGVRVRRIFGPLSVFDDDGNPVCKYAESAQHLVAGGQSLHWEFCEGRRTSPCDQYETCVARRGCEGPSDARVTVGPHALINALDGAAGNTGQLIIDEPPPALQTTELTLSDLDHAEAQLSAFEEGYADAMRPALHAARAWITRVDTLSRGFDVRFGLRSFSPRVDPEVLETARSAVAAAARVRQVFDQVRKAEGATRVDGLSDDIADFDRENADCVDCAEFAPVNDARKAPPLRMEEMMAARHNPKRAIDLGKASRTLGLLHHAVTAAWMVLGRVEELRGERALMITSALKDFALALRREGPVFVLDANAALNVEIYKEVVGYEPLLHVFRVGDGAPIERVVVQCGTANRKCWMPNGKLRVEPSFLNALRVLLSWAKEDANARSLGIITFKPVRLALEVALQLDGAEARREDWRAAGQSQKALDELVAALRPVLDTWEGAIVLGHYGAVRGLNSMAGLDCLATLGDPWPNLDSVRRDAAYMEAVRDDAPFLDQADVFYLGEDDWGKHAEALCRAELEQAHGRLRTVHRERPGRALHVGRVLPGGLGWSGGKPRIRMMPVGRPSKAGAMTVEDLQGIIARHGSLSKAARAADCSRAYLQGCLRGTKPVSEKAAKALRAI